MVSVLNETRHSGGFIVSEANGFRSRDAVTLNNAVASEVTWPAGLVLSKVLLGAITAAAMVGTGNATVASLTLGAKAQAGAYVITMTAATTFVVRDPEGDVIVSNGVLGTAVANNQINFTASAGGTPAVATDTITITVAAGSGKYVPYTGAGTTGTQTAAAVLHNTTIIAASSDRAGSTIVSRAAEVNSAELMWDAAVTDSVSPTPAALKALAAVQLAAVGIIGR